MKFSVVLLVMYFILTVFYEWSNGRPLYTDNLNWFCKVNNSYLYNRKSYSIKPSHQINETCHEYTNDGEYQNSKLSSSDYNCEDFSSTYYCADKINSDLASKEDFAGLRPHSLWYNAGFFVFMTFFILTTAFILNWITHTIKLFGTEPYLGQRDLDENGYIIHDSSSMVKNKYNLGLNLDGDA
mmetsp:Transcript_34992/g.53713  ORF Transcript_34992/g.53713 Transcript_34992/m.53713 type:complete len:183 (+) Transcript_34992:872-1420(+)